MTIEFGNSDKSSKSSRSAGTSWGRFAGRVGLVNEVLCVLAELPEEVGLWVRVVQVIVHGAWVISAAVDARAQRRAAVRDCRCVEDGEE